MHLGNGAITPECAAIACGAAAAGLATGAVAMRHTGVTREKLLHAAALGTLVFAAQAINVPVWSGISAHLIGGVLLAAALGPGLGAWTMALVLAIQAFMFGDGGLAALGANVLNMALVPAGIVAVAGRFTLRLEARPNLPQLGFAAALAVVLAAGLIVVETSAFRPLSELTGWSRFAAAMLGTHLWIGLLEGLLTAAIVVAFAWITSPAEGRVAARQRLAYVIAAILLVVALVPLSSEMPDGYEAAVQTSGMQWLLGE